jgi:hypothetical protein
MISVKPKHKPPPGIPTETPDPEPTKKFGGGWGAAAPIDHNKGTGTENYCKPDMMSMCTAGIKWKDHIRCKYAYKSQHNNRCQHFVMHSNCDSLEAQKNS